MDVDFISRSEIDRILCGDLSDIEELEEDENEEVGTGRYLRRKTSGI